MQENKGIQKTVESANYLVSILTNETNEEIAVFDKETFDVLFFDKIPVDKNGNKRS